MQLTQIDVKNFRLLKNFSLDVRKDLSLIVGKNNTGKTSLMAVMDKFLGSSKSNIKFIWNDFSISFQQKFYNSVKAYKPDVDNEQNFISDGIRMILKITYDEHDSYDIIHKFMMDLEEDNNVIILEFSYFCTEDRGRELSKIITDEELSDFTKFSKYMNKKSHLYFESRIVSKRFDMVKEEITKDESDNIKSNEISQFINFKIVKANRDMTNKENDHSLSKLSSEYYKLKEDNDMVSLEDLHKEISTTDNNLNKIYNGTEEEEGIFTQIIESVKNFGGHLDESIITIESTINEIDLLKGNTTLFYKHQQQNLPENHNGLGYLNLIGMIFEIETILASFHGKKNTKKCDLNLIFIEEPEAHTHPQLQYIFMKNIKNLINNRKYGKNSKQERLNVQTLMTTHSSHILSSCDDFDDIKYLKLEKEGIDAKNLKDLAHYYTDYEENIKYESSGHEFISSYQMYKFIKQYLTLNSSELFFADKVIINEGDTERILLPAMLNKIDSEFVDEHNLPLLSQNISLLSVGAHAYLFKPLFDFLGLKVLIITDIDGVKSNGKNKRIKCKSDEAEFTSNNTLINLFGLDNSKPHFTKLCERKFADNCIDSRIQIVYQSEKEGYRPRSFEDAFIQENHQFLIDNKNKFFEGLKNRGRIIKENNDYFNIAEDCIAKKSAFATEILINGGLDNEEWCVPSYIKEGLLWLKN